MQTAEDSQLLQTILADPQTGLPQLLERYGGLLHGVVRHILTDERDVEECLADILVQCWRRAEVLVREDYSLKAWLIVTARNKAIDRYRRQRRDAAVPLPEDFELLAQELETAGPSEAEDVIAQLVEELPPPDREIFLRRYYGLQSSREIALALGMEEHNVNVRLSRGRARLKQQFVQRFGKEYGHGKCV